MNYMYVQALYSSLTTVQFFSVLMAAQSMYSRLTFMNVCNFCREQEIIQVLLYMFMAIFNMFGWS